MVRGACVRDDESDRHPGRHDDLGGLDAKTVGQRHFDPLRAGGGLAGLGRSGSDGRASRSTSRVDRGGKSDGDGHPMGWSIESHEGALDGI